MIGILEGFLSALAANLTAKMIQMVGSKTAAKLGKPKHKKSIEQCVYHGMSALLLKSTVSSEVTTHKLKDCFGDFFDHKAVVLELSKLLWGKPPDVEILGNLFEEEAHWDRASLPGLDFEQGMQAFIAAFLESAVFDSELNDVIQAGQLIRQTDIQQGILGEMRKLAAFFREQERRVIGIQAGAIRAKNVVNGQLVIHHVDPVGTEVRRAETEEAHYLKTLISSCDQLDLATIDEMVAAGQFVCLSDVFTTLNLEGVSRKPEQSIRDALLNPERGGDHTKEKEEREPIQAIEAMSALPGLVILGHPGGGKSTLVNYVTVQLALRRQKCAGKVKPLPGWDEGKSPLPVRIILRQLASEMTADEPNGNAGMVWDFIKKQLKRDGCEGFYKTLEEILKGEGGVIFFDGMDEVAQNEDDPRRTRIKEAIYSFSKPLFDTCNIIVTSRKYAYDKSEAWRLPSDEFPAVILDVFNMDQIKAFTEVWYSMIGPKKGWPENKQRKDADDLFQAVSKQSRLRELAQYPLLLTLMVHVHGAIGYLPESRADLYERAVNLLLAHWDNRLIRETDGNIRKENSLIMRLDVRLETLRSALGQVAFYAHEKQENQESRTLQLPRILMQDLLIELDKDLNNWEKGKRVIEFIPERSGMLHTVEEFKSYVFPHQSFQEFLAAVYIMEKSDYHTFLRNLILQDLVWWREVFLLAAGYSRKKPTKVAEIIRALVPPIDAEEKKYTGQVTDALYVHLCAQALIEVDFTKYVEEEREDRGGTCSEIYERIQKSLMKTLTLDDETFSPRIRAESGRLLGRIGDFRKAVMTVEHMEFCYVPGGMFFMGEKANKHPNEHLQFDFWISRYPITNAQFEIFVQNKGYQDRCFWSVAEKAGFWNESGFRGEFDLEYRRTRPYDYGSPFNLPNYPVVGITWYESLAFTQWLTEYYRHNNIIDEKWLLRLPTEAEWEKAARGGLEIPNPMITMAACEKNWRQKALCISNPEPGWIYPCGNELNIQMANYEDTGIGATCAVGCFSKGMSRYGCLDMAGNVSEWTMSLWGQDIWDFEAKSFCALFLESENKFADNEVLRVLRGGSHFDSQDSLRCAARSNLNPDYHDPLSGFRCVCVRALPLNL